MDSAFQRFCEQECKKVENSNTNLIKELCIRWNNLSNEEKYKYGFTYGDDNFSKLK